MQCDRDIYNLLTLTLDSALSKRRDILNLIFLYIVIRSNIDCPEILEIIKFRVPVR